MELIKHAMTVPKPDRTHSYRQSTSRYVDLTSGLTKSTSKETRAGSCRGVVQWSWGRLVPMPNGLQFREQLLCSGLREKNADPYVLGKPACVLIRSVQMINWRVPSQLWSMAILLKVGSMFTCTSIYPDPLLPFFIKETFDKQLY